MGVVEGLEVERGRGSLRVPAGLVRPLIVPLVLLREPLLFVLGIAAAAGYALESIVRHGRFESGYDLALFDQAVWHYSRLEAPHTHLVSAQYGSHFVSIPNLLGDHFHPIVAVLAPLYWIWPGATTLLAAQAVLVAASVVPVFLFCRLQVGRLGAYLFSAGYLLFWGMHSGVGFEFHEVAFAPLLIAGAVYFSAVERWPACFASLGLLLLVKEDLAIVVAFFGLYLLVVRRVRPGLVALAGGAGWYELATKAFLPHFASGHGFRHWSFEALGNGPGQAIHRILGNPTQPFLLATDRPEKSQTLFFTFATFLLLALYSPLLILAIPLVAERMLSSKPMLWAMTFHYSLAIAPVIAMASAEGLRNLLGHFRFDRRRTAAIAVVGAAIVVANLAESRSFPLRELTHRSFYSRSSDARFAAQAVARIPAHDRSVAAEGALLPHLSERSDVYVIEPGTPDTEYIAYRVGDPSLSGSQAEQVERFVAERATRYRLIYSGGPYRVLQLK